MQLLQQYSLNMIEVLKLHGELLRASSGNDATQAQIELKLTPIAPVAGSFARFGHILQANLSVEGTLGAPVAHPADGQRANSDALPLFNLEVRINACYRPLLDQHGTPIGDLSFEHFHQLHLGLGRQLFPILHSKANQLLNELGLSHIRLPMDIAPEPSGHATVRHESADRSGYH